MKHLLLLTAFILFAFPSFSQWIHQDEMTVGELYDFEVGDVFETITPKRSTIFCPSWTRITVHDKEIFPDSVIYEVERQRLSGTIYSEYGDHGWQYYCRYSNSVDSVKNIYRQLNESMYTISRRTNIDTLIEYDYNNDTVEALNEITTDPFVLEMLESIPDTIKVYGVAVNGFEHYSSNYYVQGLGIVRIGSAGIDDGVVSSMTYFEKSYGTYGTPRLFPTGTDNIDYPINRRSVYPNPAKDLIYFEDIAFTQPYQFQIFNLQGEQVQQGLISSEQQEAQLHNLSSGLYLVRVEGNIEPVKLIVQ